MKPQLTRITFPLILAAAVFLATHCHAVVLPTVVRGGHNVLLQAKPGPLTIKLHKKDLNIYDGADEMSVKVFNDRRELVATLEIPDDGNPKKGGGMGQLQTTETTIQAPRNGTYRLAMAAGGDLMFGMETSADNYLVEGVIALNDPSVAGQVYFRMPSSRPMRVTVRGPHTGSIQKIPLLDAKGDTIHTFDVQKTNEVYEYTVPVGAGDRGGLWHFDIPKMDIHIKAQAVIYWTMDKDAYFTPGDTLYMLGPWHPVRYVQPDEETEVTYALRNYTDKPVAFNLRTEADFAFQAVDTPLPIQVPPNATTNLRFKLKAPAGAKDGDTARARITLTATEDPDTILTADCEVRIGASLVSKPLDLPVAHKPYQHENYLFGYAPPYSPNPVHFDHRNRPFIRANEDIQILAEGRWLYEHMLQIVQEQFPAVTSVRYGLGKKISFDAQDRAYTIVRAYLPDKQPSLRLLAHSADHGKTWRFFELPGGGGYDIEHFTGHNDMQSPPPLLRYTSTGPHPARWASIFDLHLLIPTMVNGELQLTEPLLISDNCIGACQHSGGPASLATRDGKTHVVWGETTPVDEDAPGVPTYCATYDHATGKLGEKTFMAYAPPANDVHNVPAICLDSEGYLHVLTGAHGAPFHYLRSLKPNDAHGGWTEPIDVLTAGSISDNTDADGIARQTYISLLCDPQDTLHIAYRQWRSRVDDYHGENLYGALSYQTRPKDGPWSEARSVVVPPVSGYSIYYHKLTIDHRGNLWLAYQYYSGDETYRRTFLAHNPHHTLLTSTDLGQTWKLAETADFLTAMK